MQGTWLQFISTFPIKDLFTRDHIKVLENPINISKDKDDVLT